MRVLCMLFLLFSSLQSLAEWGTSESELGDSIIRQAIAKNNYHRNLDLKASAYLKNSLILDRAPKRFLGKNVRELLKLRSSNKQVLYLHEAISDIYFYGSSTIKEEIKSYKNYGPYKKAWQFNRAADLLLDFNKDYIELEGFSAKKYVSPIAKNALKYYKFIYERSFDDENGNNFYVIRIFPRSFIEPGFYGYLYINSSTMQISSLSLNLGDNGGISLINSLTISQNLIKIDSFYYPSKTTIHYYGKNFGFAYSGTCMATYSYFSKNAAEDDIFKKHEVLIIEKPNRKSDKILESKRTLYLTSLEAEAYHYQDSLKEKQGEKKYLDSLDKLNISQRLYPLLFNSFKIQNSYREYTLSFDPIAPALFYNTVEGPGIAYGVRFTKYKDVDGSYYSIRPEIRYGFKNKEFNSDLAFNWLYSPFKRGIINISLGSTYRDLNPNGSLSSVNNSLNTLLFEQNFMKLFRKQYVSFSSGRELSNGLYFSGGLELSRNISVSNMFDYSLRNIRNRNFTSNNPFDKDDNGKLFPDHTTFRLSGTLVYTFNHSYITNEGIKMYELPRAPRLILSYKKGIPNFLGSETKWDYIEFEAQQEKLNLGLWGYSSFSISTGKFFNQKVNYFPDWKHFGGNMALIFNPGLKNFHLLDYYAYSTEREFIEGHWEHDYNAKFLGSIPLIRKLKLQELTGAAFLTQPYKGIYYELYLGIKRMGARLDYAFSFDNDGFLNHGFKFSFKLQNPFKKLDHY
ncbi:hypothetical protein Pedsa_3667 [Pseudopedobacter saltans DSM 12145]|uniref:Uncharacterized protein n=1 Tax=Pseudopedobacter saltans (strain ATCC 51119 / DSM 12145 / JCM 21818 / CCUG 39354 / LMG 10337 / NBRC 100064 / NCIMB 13643) TaxID=762903 RepID=F0S5M2_PSESL|nr:DUF5686 family protein [Pseudopedobacter saltans]ADY54196.1 hypothetical protein Pedsa_3667 [Pseudopedobacter saltans DSM 12145]